MIIEIEAEYQSDAGTTKDTHELWGVFCEYLWENQPRSNGTALYLSCQMKVKHVSVLTTANIYQEPPLIWNNSNALCLCLKQNDTVDHFKR